MAGKESKPNIVFVWSGIDRQGKKVSGELDSQGTAYVRSIVRRQGISVKSIRKKPKSLFSKKIKPKDIAIASRQIATMLGAGIPIAQSYKAIAAGTDHPKVREIFDSIRVDVEGGNNVMYLPLDKMAPSAGSGVLPGAMSRGLTSQQLREVTDAVTEQLRRDLNGRNQRGGR